MPNKATYFIEAEFNRQVNNLLDLGYAKIAKLTPEQFVKKLKPLKQKLKGRLWPVNLEKGHVPFVIVVKPELVPVQKAFKLVNRQNKSGVIKLNPKSPEDFLPTKFVKIPKNSVYLLFNINRGDEYRSVLPSVAEKSILKKKRTPLSIEEGTALLTHFPDLLAKNHCFSLLASRIPNDKRVPAIWINAKKEPNLGWCWYNNPHTWLGSAFCEARI